MIKISFWIGQGYMNEIARRQDHEQAIKNGANLQGLTDNYRYLTVRFYLHARLINI